MKKLIYNEIGRFEGAFHRNPSDLIDGLSLKGSDEIPSGWKIDLSRSDFFYKKASKKKKIVISISESDIRGAMTSALSGEEKASHAFVVSEGGSVYQLFDPKFWSYHLPKGSSGGTQKMSKETVSILLCNHGELSLSGETLLTKAGEPYCMLSDTHAYFKGGFDSRGYHAVFSDVQMRSLSRLIDKLCSDFKLERSCVDAHYRGKQLKAGGDFTILGAENFSADGKGPGPAFQWEKL